MKRKYTIRMTVDSRQETTEGDELAVLRRWMEESINRLPLVVRRTSLHSRRRTMPVKRRDECERLVLVPQSALELFERVRVMPYVDSVDDDEFLDNLAMLSRQLVKYDGPLGGVYASMGKPHRQPFQFGMLTSSYNPDHADDGHDEYPIDPPVKWTIENAEGLRIWMGALPEEAKVSLVSNVDQPSIVVERNTRGHWTVFVQPDFGDEACIIYINNDRSTKIVLNHWRDDVEVEGA